MIRFLLDLGNPIPKALHATAEFIVNTDLRVSLAEDELDPDRINSLIEEARACDLHLDNEGLGLLLQQNMEAAMEHFTASPGEDSVLEQLVMAAELARSLPFEVDLWQVQNHYYAMLQSVYLQVMDQAQRGDFAAVGWVRQFTALGEQLSVRVE